MERPKGDECYRKYLQAWLALLERDGVQPTFRELGQALGIRSTNAVSEVLVRMEAAGYVVGVGTKKSRFARVTEAGRLFATQS